MFSGLLENEIVTVSLTRFTKQKRRWLVDLRFFFIKDSTRPEDRDNREKAMKCDRGEWTTSLVKV